jgi:hypothetical protein
MVQQQVMTSKAMWGGDWFHRVPSWDAIWRAIESSGGAGADELRIKLSHLQRDIFGNPFRPPDFDPAWRTDLSFDLALGAYEDRRMPIAELIPARLTILADALEDADCTDEVILSHLRSPGPHVRGCWALDLVLGKG